MWGDRLAKAPLRRYEAKLICQESDLPLVEAWIRLHPEAWQVAYPPRYVNSVYFDSADLACLQANLTGVSDRSKLRFRWYGSLDSPVVGQLELKCKANQLGWKEIVPVATPLDMSSTTWQGIWRVLRGQAGARLGPWLDAQSQPAVLVRYHREYYESADSGLRLTLDTRIESYEQLLRLAPNVTVPSPASERIVVELKANEREQRRLSDAVNALPLPVQRHSKYVQGLLGAICFT